MQSALDVSNYCFLSIINSSVSNTGTFLVSIDTATAIFVNTTQIHDAEEIRQRHPLHGIGMPDDIAGAAVFLASSEARWITGAMLPVDGGFTAQ
jgi:NAD(P)-dependent dehydrogenase (short-subunit alcohol dehydrogenase family)